MNPLDLVGPYRGSCGLCGAVDARHRVADAIVGLVTAGDSIEAVAADYDLPGVAVKALVAVYPGGADPVVCWARCDHCHAAQGRVCRTRNKVPCPPHRPRVRAAREAVTREEACRAVDR